MDSFQRFNNLLAGEKIDYPPNFNIMMTFAAQYINEPLARYYLDYKVLCRANFAVQEAFELDILQAISDPYREAHDLGAVIEFPENGLPVSRIPLLREETDLKKLALVPPASGKRMSDRLEAVSMFKKQAQNKIPVLGWVEGAFAEAADLRGVSSLMMDIYERPDWVMELLEFCTLQEIEFAKAQILAGADIIGLGDAVASQVSPQVYKEFCLPFEKRIFAEVKKLGAISRLHICGNTSNIVEYMPESGADIIDLDWMVDMKSANEKIGAKAALCGNFDPVSVMLQGSPELVYSETIKCLESGKRIISMAGCEIPAATPPKNLHAQTRAIKDWGNNH